MKEDIIKALQEIHKGQLQISNILQSLAEKIENLEKKRPSLEIDQDGTIIFKN